MYQPTARKRRDSEGFVIKASREQSSNFLPIEVQVQLNAQARQSDKSRNRAKQERRWKKEERQYS